MGQKSSTGRSASERTGERRVDRVVVAALCGGLAVWIFLIVVPYQLLGNRMVIGAWLVFGVGLVPAVMLLLLSRRLRPSDTVTPARLLTAALAGGPVALALAATMNAVIPDGVLGLVFAGVPEELAKGLVVVAVGWTAVKSLRNGLFVGGAVGVGFEFLENAAYLVRHITTNDEIWPLVGETVQRGLSVPIGHMLWTSLLGAALFAAAAATQRFRLTLGVVGAYAGVALLHGFFDGFGPLMTEAGVGAPLDGVTAVVGLLAPSVIGVVVWRRVARAHPAPLAAT